MKSLESSPYGIPIINIKANFFGQDLVVVNTSALIVVVERFRPFIQAFLYMMLAFYNVNNVYKLVRKDSLLNGGLYGIDRHMKG